MEHYFEQFNQPDAIHKYSVKEAILNPKVSIIIPVYNVARYLRKCLDSCISQTFKEIEIICINDGSTDNSLDILDEYASEDKRIVLLSQENHGQGIARNKGIDISSGEYLMFIDPDDWIEPDTVETIYNKFVETKVNLIQFNYDIRNDDGTFRKNKQFSKQLKKHYNYKLQDNDIYNWKQIKLKSIQNMSMCIWDKAYSANLIKNNNIKLAPNKYGEDHILSISSNLLADKILYLNKYFYHYRDRKGSAANITSDDNFCIFENVELLRKFLQQHGLFEEFKQLFFDYRVNVLSWHYTCIPEGSVDKYLQKCKEILSKKNINYSKRKPKEIFH